MAAGREYEEENVTYLLARCHQCRVRESKIKSEKWKGECKCEPVRKPVAGAVLGLTVIKKQDKN